ncbi:serine protease [Pseudomonadota bacterium]
MGHYFYQPIFEIDGKKYYSGKGFLIEVLKDRYFVTAHHLFGPAGGYKRNFRWDEMSNITDLKLVNPLTKDRFSIGPGINIVGAEPAFSGNYSADIAVFRAPNIEDDVSPLTKVPPKVGETVWLYSSSQTDGVFHPAYVVESSENRLLYQFFDSDFKLKATSGAPVLNEKGEVVAINILGSVSNSRVIGLGNPVSIFLSKIESAIARDVERKMDK